MASRTRRLLTAAIYGGGGLGVLGAAVAGLLMSEAKLARRKVEERTPKDDPPSGDGKWGRGRGRPIVFAVLGDSSAVGLGVDYVTETPGVMIASGLSELAGRPVRLVRLAVSGSESKDLDGQVTEALTERPDVAMIMIGVNDVTGRTRPSVSVRYLADAVRRLRDADCETVVCTCPDLGTIRPIPQPLRWVARRWSRQLAAAQTVAVVGAGGRTVSIGAILSPEFARDRSLFSADEFHPSAAGYAAAAATALPSVADALGVWPAEADRKVRTFGRDGVRPVAKAAARAAGRAGTEVRGTQVAGSDLGPDGRWAQSRRRDPVPVFAPERGEA